MRKVLMVALAAAVIFAAVPAVADTTFAATLLGVNETPPNPSPGTGFGTFVLNNAQTQLTFDISFSGLLAPETAAHFHRGAPGVAGPVQFTLPTGSPKQGVWNLAPANVADLFGGLLYVNVHSTQFPGGEIRGQVERAVPELASPLLAASGMGALVLRRRRFARN